MNDIYELSIDRTTSAPVITRQVYVNVIMRKMNWIVRVATLDNELSVFAIAPSVEQLRQRLETDFPDCDVEIDFAGLFEII